MSPAATVAVVVVAVWVAWMVALVWWTVRKGLQSTPWRVVRVLTEGLGPYEVKVTGFRSTWNPAKPLGSGSTLSGPGTGIYRLDESGVVHLTWTPKRGPIREFSGSVPDRVRPDSEQTISLRKKWHRILYMYTTTVVVGFLVGFTLAGGSVPHRLAGGGIGVFVAFIVLAVGGTIFSALLSFRRQPCAR